MSIIVSFFENTNVFVYENNRSSTKNESRGIKMFCSNSGDHFSMFMIMRSFISQKMSKSWCKSNNIS